MLRKLLLAATITLSLHLFLAVNSSSHSHLTQPSAHNTTQTPPIANLELEPVQLISANNQN